MTAKKDDLVAAWRRGKPVKVRLDPSPTTVLSIRISRDLLRNLSERGAAQGKPASEYARDLIEAGLASNGRTPADLERMFSKWLREYESRKPGSRARGSSAARHRA